MGIVNNSYIYYYKHVLECFRRFLLIRLDISFSNGGLDLTVPFHEAMSDLGISEAEIEEAKVEIE